MIFGKSYITKEFTFDAMHQLPNHSGLCKNYHGHTYKVQVTLTGIVDEKVGSSSEGMVYDFGKLKKVMKKVVMDKMDHAFIAKGDEDILPSIQELGTRVFILGERTTAENLAKYIFGAVADATPKTVFVKNIRVYETPTSWADYKSKEYEQKN